MEPLLGQIAAFAFTFTPAGWIPCDGRLVSVELYPALFQLIGTTYGGDGQTTFGVPNVPPISPQGPQYCILPFGNYPS